MFDIYRAFRALSEQPPMDYERFRTEIGNIRAQNLRDLPPEVTTEELVELLRKNKFLFEEGGRVRVIVNPPFAEAR